ncbi:MAG TPA: ABC transporter permease [Dehalococcoidales bacterium]|nr:ABC transporter permease [Dehalococcoidales bacterium]
MMNQIKAEQNIQADTVPKISEFRRSMRVMFGRKVVLLGVILIFAFIFIAACAPFISPLDPYEQNLENSLKAPSLANLLGTDAFGRDTLSRLFYGARISLLVGIVAVSMASVIGILLGLVASYYGGWLDNIIMRIIDTLMALPPIVLVLAIAAALGGGIINIMISIGVGMIPSYCRLTYGQVQSLKENDYILAERVVGSSGTRIMFNHLLPNAFPPLIVLITLNMGSAILMEATLSFIGIGILPPTAAWGSMINDGQRFLLTNPVLSFAPGVAILLVVLAFNLVGDGLRDALDPRLRGTL